MQFRNVVVDIDGPTDQLGFEAVLTMIERGGITEWRRLTASVRAAPYGKVAGEVEIAVSVAADEAPGASVIMRGMLERARRDFEKRNLEVAGKMIRMARSVSGMTQAELARRAQTTQSLISGYESGNIQPTVSVLMRLIDATGVNLNMRLSTPLA